MGMARGDAQGEAHKALLNLWSYADPADEGITASSLICSLNAEETDPDRLRQQDDLRQALLELCDSHDIPSPKSVGKRLSALDRSSKDGKRLVGLYGFSVASVHADHPDS